MGYTDGTLGSTAQICTSGNPCDSSLTTDGVFLYIADRYNHSIRKIGPLKTVISFGNLYNTEGNESFYWFDQKSLL